MILSKSDTWMNTSNNNIQTRQKNNILTTHYLIVDKISMATSELTAITSGIAGKIKGETVYATAPFGGMNVILIGDFHQFPQHGCSDLAMYNSMPPNKTVTIGRTLYLQFETVVILHQQTRIRDQQWTEIPQRGECTTNNINKIWKLVLTDPNCDVPDFTKEPWKSATLVTPHHGVWNPWNPVSVKKHCAETSQTKYIFLAEDTWGPVREPLTLEQQVIVAGMKEKKTVMVEHWSTMAIEK